MKIHMKMKIKNTKMQMKKETEINIHMETGIQKENKT